MSVIVYFKNSKRVFIEGVISIQNLYIRQQVSILHYDSEYDDVINDEYDIKEIANITINNFYESED